MARIDPKSPGLLPCRIHNFFRGLAGLWVCMDAACSELTEDERSGICGKMYSQPRESCDCGARVHELYTCRYCGTAYARAYTDDVDSPSALWSEPGQRLRMEGGETSPLLPLDMLLEQPSPTRPASPPITILKPDGSIPTSSARACAQCTCATTGRPHRWTMTARSIKAWRRAASSFRADVAERLAFRRTTVQDHQTKGDQPFQALVAKQIQIQPPKPARPSRFAPLRGRKVLVFSDSRQVAARLAPNLQMYSTRDSLRSLIAWGYQAASEPSPASNRS